MSKTSAFRSTPYITYLRSVDDEDDPVIRDYHETPRGQYSEIHSITASPRKLKQWQLKRQKEIDAKTNKYAKNTKKTPHSLSLSHVYIYIYAI